MGGGTISGSGAVSGTIAGAGAFFFLAFAFRLIVRFAFFFALFFALLLAKQEHRHIVEAEMVIKLPGNFRGITTNRSRLTRQLEAVFLFPAYVLRLRVHLTFKKI